ncbi:MAG: two pore domain potassium channel family protein [Anaerolineae bacterium]|nr:two pore domain potassium channel family protein [Anaerolineae bacterium]
MTTKTDPPNDALKGKVIYFLILVILNQFMYPITQQGGIFLILYQFLYASMFAAGIYIASDSRFHVVVTVSTALIYLGFGFWYALDPTDEWKILAAYVALVPFLAMVLMVLFRYIFLARTVTHDVIYAAISIYLLLGGIFVPIYGILESLWPGSLVDGAAPDAPIVWQQLIYFSYVSLTTAGYGDFLPVSWWARSIASAETVIGVLYLAILMARLVGLFSQKE